MKVSFWHHSADKKPDKTGYYLAYKSYSMGGDSTNTGYYYYNKKTNEWRDSSLSNSYSANVYYWSDADPEDWVDKDPPVVHRKKLNQEMHPEEKEALENLQEAIRRYETIRALCAKS